MSNQKLLNNFIIQLNEYLNKLKSIEHQILVFDSILKKNY